MGEWQNPLKGWYNKPDKKVSINDNKITMRVPKGSDCWRKTKQGLMTRNVNTAPFHWHKVSGNFQAIVRVSGSLGNDYDKAGLMVRLDEENWLFTGMEWHAGCANHCTSVTLGCTDWSISPLPEGAEQNGMWFCFKRAGEAYEVFNSDDGKTWVQARQGLFTDRPILYVGIAAAAPAGKDFKVTFESYSCTLVGEGKS